MKKTTLADQLALTTEIMAALTPEQLHEIEGGAGDGVQFSCFDSSCTATGVPGHDTTGSHE